MWIQLPCPGRGTDGQFCPSVVAKRLDGSRMPLGTEAGSLPPQNGGTASSQFSAHVLWPNDCVDQDVIWNAGPGQIVRWEPSPSLQLRGTAPVLGPCMLWSNGCMDQDTTWQGGRPRPRGNCVRWRTSSPKTDIALKHRKHNSTNNQESVL